MNQINLTQTKFLLLALCLGLTLLLNSPARADEPPRISEEEAIAAALGEIGEQQFQISSMGTAANISDEKPAVAYNSRDNEYLVVWSGNSGSNGGNDYPKIRARQIDATTGQPVGYRDQISGSQPAFSPDVAYNDKDNQYMVVWSGQVTPGKREIFGRVLKADGRNLSGLFRMSYTGPEDDTHYDSFEPAVAYSTGSALISTYFVSWTARFPIEIAAGVDSEIYGKRFAPDGTPFHSTPIRISHMGPDEARNRSASTPDVTFNPDLKKFLVVWAGSDEQAGLAPEELEIFGAQVPSLISLTPDPQFRLSWTGPDNDAGYKAHYPSVTYNPAERQYFVVWSANNAPDTDEEIFGQRLATNGPTNQYLVLVEEPVRISRMGPEGDPNFRAEYPAVAYNSATNEYLVTWSGNDDRPNLAPTETEIFGRRIDAASGQLKEADDTRFSDLGPDGDAAYHTYNAAVVYNPTNHEYLVIIQGRDDTPLVFDSLSSIFGQRVDGATGQERGDNDIILSSPQHPLDYYHANYPAVAYNSRDNLYLVVWDGASNEAELAGGVEIFGQLLDGATGTRRGPRLRISDMGPDGNHGYGGYRPAVAYNPDADEFLVVWHGNDERLDMAQNEVEIFGQLLDGATGDPRGVNDFRISDMEPDSSNLSAAGSAQVTYNPTAQEYLVVWDGSHEVGPQGVIEREIFGQRLDGATGEHKGANGFRVSFTGPPGDSRNRALDPVLTYNPQADEYLVVWFGRDEGGQLSGPDQEVFAQRLAGPSAEPRGGHLRVSDSGPEGDISYAPNFIAVAHNRIDNEYLVVWSGKDDTGNLGKNEQEVFGQRLGFVDGELRERGENDFRISFMGEDGDENISVNEPTVTYDPLENSYLVVWSGDTVSDSYSEIFGRRLQASTGQPIGEQSQFSHPGVSGVFNSDDPSLVFNPTEARFLVVWSGQDDNPFVTSGDYEVYGRFFNLDLSSNPDPNPNPNPGGDFTVFLPLVVK